jgi:uncharacterized protein (DUF305 family)
MNRTTTAIIIATCIGIIVGAGGAMAFTKSTHDSVTGTMVSPHMMANGQTMAGTSMTMKDEMTSMNAALQGKTGDAFDQEFLSEMILHHKGAVQMAQFALQSAKHKEIKDLAQNIISAQNIEISQMQNWQKNWYGVATTTGTMPGM